jgi:hypothetical protein
LIAQQAERGYQIVPGKRQTRGQISSEMGQAAPSRRNVFIVIGEGGFTSVADQLTRSPPI